MHFKKALISAAQAVTASPLVAPGQPGHLMAGGGRHQQGSVWAGAIGTLEGWQGQPPQPAGWQHVPVQDEGRHSMTSMTQHDTAWHSMHGTSHRGFSSSSQAKMVGSSR